MKAALVCVMTACCVSIAFGLDGYGVNTTGGAGGTTVTVTDAATFKSYVETENTPYIIQVQGTIDLSAVGGYVDMRSNKTVRGIGENPTIIGELGFKNGKFNVIVERLTITNPNNWGEGNGLSIKEDVLNVFVTKCTFYDCVDGLLDYTRRSDWVTVSWCKFYFTGPGDSNNRVSLIGNDDSSTDDYGKLHITFHHNWYSTNCWQRIPSVRFGKAHIYNNYYDCPNNLYGVWSRIKAEDRL
jgi:pectate lyase